MEKYNFTADREAGGRDSDELDSIYRTEWTAQSNLDIFHLSGYPSTKRDDCGPRNMQMYIQSPLNPVFSLQGIVEKLGVHSGLLGNVRRLELFVDFIQTDSSWTRHSASMASACKIASVFAKLVPSVRHIEWQADPGAPVFSVFAKHLVGGYAGQLTGFLCPQMALEETREFSSSLTQIALINAFDRPNRMPHICVENLTVLDLHLNEYSVGWNLFKGKNESTSLHFDNLAWLRIKGKNDYNARADYVDSSKLERLHEYRISAPKLKTLEATVSPFTNILLASIYGVSAIRDVKLELNDAVLCFQNLCIDPVRNVFLKHAYDRNGDFEAVDQDIYDDEYDVSVDSDLFMNDILCIENIADYSKAKIWNNYNEIDYENVKWNSLDELYIYGPISVSRLKTLVQRHSCLKVLDIDDLLYRSNNMIVSRVFTSTSNVKPLPQTRLRELRFATESDLLAEERRRMERYLKKLLPGSKVVLKN
ncbi:hypothetical protein H4S06_002530 [Coemansia sp. BCRC 34490]|nr:hypothetical protein H4S06_002530 [Coemansia sp. BCRC 34490]